MWFPGQSRSVLHGDLLRVHLLGAHPSRTEVENAVRVLTSSPSNSDAL